MTAATPCAVTIVTQTRVRPESADAFARWQDDTSHAVSAFPGFIKQTVMPPSPPAQVDWVILQRFASSDAAVAWLHSEQRLKRIEGAAAMLLGRDDIHLVNDGETGVMPSPASAVISTRIKPGQETAYRAWEQRIAGAQAKAPGFQGYRATDIAMGGGEKRNVNVSLTVGSTNQTVEVTGAADVVAPVDSGVVPDVP